MCVLYNILNNLLFSFYFFFSTINIKEYYWQDNN